MVNPTLFYRIWHSPRVGSTLLCQLLEDTGIAGKPGEHVTLHGQESLRERYGIQDYRDLIQQVWKQGTDEHGVFGVKLSHHAHYTDQIMEDLAKAKGVPKPINPEDIWKDFFPKSKNIFITRLDKIAAAISWWKAIQDNEWHLTQSEKRKTPDVFYTEKYDLDALKFLITETVLRETATVRFLHENNLEFLTISYEDLIAHPKKVINDVLIYLGLTQIPIKIPAFRYQKTSNDHNQKWIERLRIDLQKGMDKTIW